MAEPVFEEMKSYIGFDRADGDNLRSLAPFVEPFFTPVVDCFYRELLRHPKTRAVFTGGDAQIARQRRFLREWLHGLFAGRYDDAYFRERLAIGKAHLNVGLQQQYMITGMELLWRELERRLRATALPEVNAKLVSLHKLLMLELGIMLHSYQESYAERVREMERSAVEEKLTRAEHLAQIGQLAASLAHEIKNPLAGISGAIQIIREAMPEEDPHRAIIAEILGQIRRLDEAVKDLLVYARPNPPKLRPVDLNDVVRAVLTVLREEPELHRVHVVRDGAPGAVPVEADRSQLEQLVINLLINAAQASPDGGIVRVTVSGDAQYGQLRVEDAGEGMSSDVLERAFEPFFTTKAKGTGLGLAICRRIVETHGGGIELQSRPGEGTTAVVTLPLTRATAPVAARRES
ncbi:MAG TPA: protoglobin domain-containing protein [Phycisphaerae bacterium]|nr:protoglobin domain-containing protein [Phycisphaerae bacterium]